MAGISDYYKVKKALSGYAEKHGAHEFLRLIANAVIDLSYYQWPKEEGKALHSVMAALHEAQVKIK